MRLVRIDESLEPAWDRFAATHSVSLTNLSGWRKVLSESYGIPSFFLALEDEGSIFAGLCLYEFKHPLFGHYLTTAPFSTDGGLIAETDTAREWLLAEAVNLAEKRKVDYLLIRGRGEPVPGWNNDRRYETAMIDLRIGQDWLWDKTLPGKTRNQIRRGMKEGFTIKSGPDQIGPFHEVFHRHMRYLGSPAHSVDFYNKIQKHLGEYVQFMVVRDGDELVAGALLIELNGTASNIHTVSLNSFNRRCPNYLLYWEMIRGSCERGRNWFDMGRSEKGSGNIRFKLNWGAKPVELNYDYYLGKARKVPHVDPRNPRYRLAIAAWKRLPLSLAKAVGPRLIKGIG